MAETELNDNGLKRKRSSPPTTSAPPPPKAPKTTNSLQINYIARQCLDDLPLINKGDTIPAILDVLKEYTSVLDRHESLASNLGARLLGPILIKRFEKCFDAPPEVLLSHNHSKDDSALPTVTWLEVVHFAKAHPAQFTLSTFSEGRRVCQFYYPQKQVRVQVSEEDFLFIKSGRCQDLIPPLPIWEDEEKEMGTCEILEKILRELTTAADTVAAKTRQLSHRLKGRRMAIIERRTTGDKADKTPTESETPQETSPVLSRVQAAASSGSVQQPPQTNGDTHATEQGTAPALRSDLMSHFKSLPHNQQVRNTEPRRQSAIVAASPVRQSVQSMQGENDSPVTTPAPAVAKAIDPLSYYISDVGLTPPATQTSNKSSTTNSSKHNFSRPLAPGQELSQPYRIICQQHMESLPKSARVMPPCDRCRRLKMDCLRNLTSCAGCTKKHARCHWKDVTRQEVESVESFSESLIINAENAAALNASAPKPRSTTHGTDDEDEDDEGYTPLDDLEALGRQNRAEDEESVASITRAAAAADSRPPSQQPGDPSTAVFHEAGLEHARKLARLGSSQQEDIERNGVAATAQYAPAFDSSRTAAEEHAASNATRYPDHQNGHATYPRAPYKQDQIPSGGWNTVNSRGIEMGNARASGMVFENGH
ncbi:hypothetical protein MBLNU457_g0038t1 [Dothideomycetes sp. NU457]